MSGICGIVSGISLLSIPWPSISSSLVPSWNWNPWCIDYFSSTLFLRLLFIYLLSKPVTETGPRSLVIFFLTKMLLCGNSVPFCSEMESSKVGEHLPHCPVSLNHECSNSRYTGTVTYICSVHTLTLLNYSLTPSFLPPNILLSILFRTDGPVS